ncbi:MAG: TIGR02678 family protein, partial [Acidimicrobiia bacterium]
DPDTFRLIRRHEADLDRWFTQRLGYRLHLDADSARLFKTGAPGDNRPLRARSGRPLHQGEYVLLALVLATTVAGPAVISLRDLVDGVRSAAAEAEISLTGDASERRAVVAVLRWMIEHGLASEMHAHVDAYATDEAADAILELRPDRIALVPLPTVVGADDPDTLLDRAQRRTATRQWLRSRLVEEPVVYREDLTESEWSELRRRLGEEERILHEMFGLVLESRAEGVAAVDPTGTLADRDFPTGGTVGHAAVLLIDALVAEAHEAGAGGFLPVTTGHVARLLAGFAERHQRRWANELVAAPERLARRVIDLLVEVRLAERLPPAGDPGGSGHPDHGHGSAPDGGDDEPRVLLLPGAARFRPKGPTADGEPADDRQAQEALW